MNVKDTLSEEKTRRVALAPLCMVLAVAMEHVPSDYVLARLAHKQFARWVGGGKFDKVIDMRPTLHDEVVRAQKKFTAWDKLPDFDDKTNLPKARGPIYTFAALRSLENAITAGLSGDEGDLAEAIDDLDDIPLAPPPEEEKQQAKGKKSGPKVRVVKDDRRETLADLMRSLGEVLSIRPQSSGQSKAS